MFNLMSINIVIYSGFGYTLLPWEMPLVKYTLKTLHSKSTNTDSAFRGRILRSHYVDYNPSP